jgi:hypothetical protein
MTGLQVLEADVVEEVERDPADIRRGDRRVGRKGKDVEEIAIAGGGNLRHVENILRGVSSDARMREGQVQPRLQPKGPVEVVSRRATTVCKGVGRGVGTYREEGDFARCPECVRRLDDTEIGSKRPRQACSRAVSAEDDVLRVEPANGHCEDPRGQRVLESAREAALLVDGVSILDP